MMTGNPSNLSNPSLGSFGTGGGRSPDSVTGDGVLQAESCVLVTGQQEVVVSESSGGVEISHVMEEDISDLQDENLGKEVPGMEGMVTDDLSAIKMASQSKTSYASITARATEVRDSSNCSPRKESVEVKYAKL
ncbi:hypothetical protein V6N13_124206 [Hibiscus sabdariffa]|uniref:Uncharacterized protein n=1 Tax=Hibiscus sabdariffa TaxID=183260 RepID=A0ABR2S111_9ROSI